MNIAFIIMGVIVIVGLAMSIRINHQKHEMIVERLGRYCKTWTAGLHILIPFVDQVVRTISLKEQIVEIEPQSVITKDNSTVMVDVVVFYRVSNSYQYCYGVEDAAHGIQNLVATSLRNIIGEMELDGTLSGRQTINARIAENIDEPTRPWGLQILRAEIKNIRPPTDVQNAMEKQLKAEREKRSAILNAEGDKQAAILIAEGHKEAAIRMAEGDKEATILRAEAYGTSKRIEAEGEAQAIISLQTAQAKGITFINESHPSSAAIKLEQIKAVRQIASSPSSKTILPVEMRDLTSLASLAAGVKETVSEPSREKRRG